VEPKLAEDAATNNGKQKLSINDLRNPSIVSKMAVSVARPGPLSWNAPQKQKQKRKVGEKKENHVGTPSR
jgi:hypothetical protein